MAEPTFISEPFVDAHQQEEAATVGLWIFLATELLLFGGLFTGYLVYRSAFQPSFAEAAGHLDLWLGAINTAVLLTSSLTMALAVEAAGAGRRKLLASLLIATALLGLGFLGIKGWEYYQEIEKGLAPFLGVFEFPSVQYQRAELFFNLYFVMTGLHALHLLSGVGMLLTLVVLIRYQSDADRLRRQVKHGGLYWHFVDLMWVFLFPLLYLLDR